MHQKSISIYHDIDLEDIAQEISDLDEKDLSKFLLNILDKKEDFDFEEDLVLKLFDNLRLQDVVLDYGAKSKEDMDILREFLDKMQSKIDKIKEMIK